MTASARCALVVLLWLRRVACDGRCADSTSWFKSGASSKDCAWVAKGVPDRCVAKAEDGSLGFEGCVASCGNTAVSECADDEGWHKKGAPSKDCFWISRWTPTRCWVVGTDARYGFEACRKTCRACDECGKSATAAPTASGTALVAWETALFPGGAPNDGGFEGQGEDVRLGDDGARRAYDVDAPTLASWPAASGAATTAVVVLPGGGYKKVALGPEGDHVAAALAAERNVDAYVVKYRVPSRGRDDDEWGRDAPLADAQRAVSLVRSLGSDTAYASVGVVGFSAGGNLAARLCASRDRAYEPQDDVDDLPYAPDFAILVYPWDLAEDNGEDVFSFDLEDDFDGDDDLVGFPPTYLVHASDDETAPYLNSLAFFHHLRQKNDDPVYHLEVHATGGHGFGICSLLEGQGGAFCEWPSRAFAFLEGAGVAL